MNSHDASHDSLHVLQHLVDLSLGTRVRDIMIVTTAVLYSCTVDLTGKELAHSARAAYERGIS